MAKLSSYSSVTPLISDTVPVTSSNATHNVALSSLPGTVTKTVATSGYVADYICDGTADEVQIQQAVDAVYSAGGGEIKIKKGSYVLADAVNLYSNVAVILENGTTLTQGTNTKSVFVATGSSGNHISNVYIGGGTLVAPSTGSGTTAVVFTYVDNSLIENIDASYGTTSTISLLNCTKVIIQGCKVHLGILHAIRLKASQYCEIINNHVYDVAIAGVGQGIYLYDGQCYDNIVSNNIVTNIQQTGIRVEGSRNIVSGNILSGCGRSAIKEEVFGTSKPAGGSYRNQFINNTMTDCNRENGGHAVIWVQNYETICSGNIIFASGSYDSAADGIVVNGRHANISNNNIQGVGNGILAEHSETVISGNNVKFCQHYGIWLSALLTGTNYSAIHEFSTLSGNVVMNNGMASVGADPGIRVSATGASTYARNLIISGNIISDNQSKYTGTLTGSAASGQKVLTIDKTAETVTDPLFVTPSWGFVIGQNIVILQGATTENAVIASVDSETQLTVVTNLTNSYTAGATVTARPSQKYGVQYVTATGGSVDRTILTNNVMLGNTTSGTSVAADANIVNANNITS